MRRVLAVFGVLAVASMPAPTHAWGFEAHKFIMERAIGLLPAEFRPFFEQYKSTLVERAIDPDTWQVAGFNDQEDPESLSRSRLGRVREVSLYRAAARLYGSGRQVRQEADR